MQHLIDCQPAYLLHSRPFRDTSLILDFLTRDYGRISVIAKGVRRPKSKNKGLLQAFIPLSISLVGKSELKILRNVEIRKDRYLLKGNYLFAGLYLNELMVRLIFAEEVEGNIINEYEHALSCLANGHELEPVLRTFELNLLNALGYGIEFNYEASSGELIEADAWYYFQHENGFERIHDEHLSDKSAYYPGHQLLKIGEQNYSSLTTRKIAKKILRVVLSIHLGDKPLKSRQLFTLK